MAPWMTSTMPFTSRCVSRRGGRLVQRLASSTVRPPKPGKKGASINPSGAACPRASRRLDPGDAGKKTKGRKRHIVVDALGMLLGLKVQPASVQDIIGAFPVMQAALQKHPSIQKFLADGGYQLPRISAALAEIGSATLSIVKRPQSQGGFVPLPKRWIVERTFAWISNCRRLARDYERHIKSGAAFVKLAMIKIMLRRLARKAA